MPSPSTLKQKLGALVYDVPRLAASLRRSSGERAAAPWVFMRNRDERLEPGPAHHGARCLWQWTSQLHVANVFPGAGRLLMARCFGAWPIAMKPEPDSPMPDPKVSFLIGHRGVARLPHLLETLKSIAGQAGVPFECIVVEQSTNQEIRDALPAWVRYVHTPPADAAMPYSRSWAFNVAAKASRGELLIFHDNDMLVPGDYAAEMHRRWRDGFEVINLKRFIFYLDEGETRAVFACEEAAANAPPEFVLQNAEGGGSVGCVRSVFFDLGGWDEQFVGWGGEDNEFWERAQTVKVWAYGYLPLIHLSHPAQSGKADGAASGTDMYRRRSAVDPRERIRELRAGASSEAATFDSAMRRSRAI